MANKCDFNSSLPRVIKRMLSLSPETDPHQRGAVRRIFLDAHKRHKEIRVDMLVNKSQNVDVGTPEEVIADV